MAIRHTELAQGRAMAGSGWRLPLWAVVVGCLVLAGAFGFALVRQRHHQPLTLRCLAATAEPMTDADGRMIVTSLDANGPAARAGVRVGDILPPGLTVPAASGSDLPMRFSVGRDDGHAAIAVVLPNACHGR